MSQFDFATIDPNAKSGTQLAVDLNNWRDALHSGHRGAERPAYAQGGILWVRETSSEQWDLMLYDGDTDFVLRSVNPTTNQLLPIPKSAVDGLQGISDSVAGLGSAATRDALGVDGAVYSQDSILGTVSQSGGVPTGAIIERGSNANGEYVRWADGTQICRSPAISTTLSTTSGSVFNNQGATLPTWTFPAVFSVPPQVYSIPGTNSTTWGSASAGETATQAILRIFASGNVGITTVSGFAIGRWF